jgi:hypothetical protein
VSDPDPNLEPERQREPSHSDAKREALQLLLTAEALELAVEQAIAEEDYEAAAAAEERKMDLEAQANAMLGAIGISKEQLMA